MSNQKVFTVVWTVEKCTFLLENQLYYTPVLKNDTNNTRWKLSIHRKMNNVYFRIYYLNGREKCGNVNAKLSLLSVDGSALATREWKNENFLELHEQQVEVFGARIMNFLTWNMLTVRCCIEWTKEKIPVSKSVFVRTLIGEENASLLWPIPTMYIDFSQTMSRHLYLTEKVKQFKTLCIELLLDKDGKLFLNIEGSPCKYDDNYYTVSLNFRISIMNVEGLVANIHKRNLMFKNSVPKVTFEFPCLRDQGETMYLRKGYVLLKCEFKFFGGITANYIEDLGTVLINDCLTSNLPPITSKPDQQSATIKRSDNQGNLFNCVINDWRKLFENRTLSDYTLRTLNKPFHVHKAVLCARSPVLCAMLTTDMQEARSEYMDISDVDAVTLQRFLVFLYTNDLDTGLKWVDTSKLYSVADKYEVLSLQKECRALLVSHLAVTNACDTLVLADMHQDDELRKTVLEFISRNDSNIIGTEQWKEFQTKYVHLAVETLSELYTKKMRVNVN